MKFTLILVACGFISIVYAYTQNDLLTAQYNYQAASDKLTQAKDEKKASSDALANAKQKLADAQQQYQAAQIRSKNAESALIQANKNFATISQNVNLIWNSLNPHQ